MGLDARVRYTKMVIKNSFVELLKQKPLNKITVKEICELSEINRATFYKYYLDVYDLLDKIEETFLDEISQLSKDSKGFKEIFSLILVSMKSDMEIYKALFSENGDRNFPSKILMKCHDNMMTDIRKRFGKLSEAEQKWLYYFIARGCGGILEMWIKNGMTEPVEQVTDFAESLVLSTVSKFG